MFVEIKNWEKYNPRSDIKNTTWFRLENNFWIDPALTPIDSDGKLVWLVLLSFASQKQTGVIEVDNEFVASILKIDRLKVDATIQHLQSRDKIKIRTSRGRHVDVTRTSHVRDAHVPLRDGTERDGTKDISPPPGDPPSSDPDDQALASAWADFARGMSRTVKPSVPKWTNTVRLLREKDGLSHDELRDMLAFVKSDHFWQHQAISLEGLRGKSKNGLRKFENILAAMRQAPPRLKPAENIPSYTEADIAQFNR